MEEPVEYEGAFYYETEAPNPDDRDRPWRLAIAKTRFHELHGRGMYVRLTQGLKIVLPGLILARHIYKGLRRPLLDGENMRGSDDKLVFVLSPSRDYRWDPSNRYDPTKIIDCPPPKNAVFTVIASQPNPFRFDGLVERWAWVEADPDSPDKPVSFPDRYDHHIYSKPSS